MIIPVIGVTYTISGPAIHQRGSDTWTRMKSTVHAENWIDVLAAPSSNCLDSSCDPLSRPVTVQQRRHGCQYQPHGSLHDLHHNQQLFNLNLP